jgi:type IV secretion system protein VirD4
MTLLYSRLCRVMLLAAALLLSLSFGELLRVYTLPVLGLLCFAAWPRVRQAVSGSHGTARVANYNDLRRRKLLGKSGLMIGRATFTGRPRRRQALLGLLSPLTGSADAVRTMLAAFWRGYDNYVIHIHDYVHAICFAPSGAGKGTCVQIPNLFTYRGSMVVVDPQGTLLQVTSWFREHILGHKIIKMDPMGFTGPAEQSDCLNALDFIDENSPNFVDEIRAVAELMVKREPNEFQPHFNDWAVIILSAMLAFICSCEADASKRSMLVMRDLVSSKEGFLDAMRTMRELPGVVGKWGGMLSIPVEKELASILSTVQRHTAFMDSPPVAANLSKSTWDPRWLWSGKVTVYLILPSDKLSTLSPLMRLWIGTILKVITQKGASEKHPILFMIDEAAHIGKIQILEDAITLMRAFGVRIWLFFQSVNQLQECYGNNAQTILDNMSIQQFFGTNAFESADHISKRVGDCTILVEQINRNRQRSRPTGPKSHDQPGSVSSGDGVTISETGRRLLKPEEILVLPSDVSLTFYKDMHVIASELVPWHADPAFNNPKRIGRLPGMGLAAGVFSVAVLGLALAACVLADNLPAPSPSGFQAVPYDAGISMPQRPSTIPPRLRGADSPRRRPPQRGLSVPPPTFRPALPPRPIADSPWQWRSRRGLSVPPPKFRPAPPPRPMEGIEVSIPR